MSASITSPITDVLCDQFIMLSAAPLMEVPSSATPVKPCCSIELFGTVDHSADPSICTLSSIPSSQQTAGWEQTAIILCFGNDAELGVLACAVSSAISVAVRNLSNSGE